MAATSKISEEYEHFGIEPYTNPLRFCVWLDVAQHKDTDVEALLVDEKSRDQPELRREKERTRKKNTTKTNLCLGRKKDGKCCYQIVFVFWL